MNTEPNHYPALRRSASGDLDGQRELSRAALKIAAECDDWVALVEGVFLARMAYHNSNDPGDAGALISALAFACTQTKDPDACFVWVAETVALTAKLADEGVALADNNLGSIVESVGAEATELAKEMAEQMKQEEA